MILVTGANGLLGSWISRKLINAGEEFVALKRENSDLSLLNNESIKWVEGDVLDVTGLYELLKNVDTVIHCAAVVSFHNSEKYLMHAINVEGTSNVVNACIDSGVKNLIHISSIAAFGRNKLALAINENTTWVDSPLNTNYAESKYNAELEVWRGANEGLNVAVVNPSVVLAAGKKGQSSSKLLDYVWDERKFYIDGKVNYVDARDIADVVYSIYKDGIYGERYILNAGNISYKPLFDLLSGKLQKRAPSMKANGLMLKMALVAETLMYWITNIKPSVTKELIKTTRLDYTYDNSKSKATFNFTYRTLENSVDWVCEEYKKVRT